MAFANRASNGKYFKCITAPESFCTENVMTLKIPASRKKGIFSITSPQLKDAVGATFECSTCGLSKNGRCNGQKSKSNITNGSVTSIDFDIKPSENITSAKM